MLEDAGISLENLSNYTYTGSHINTVRSVLNGEYDAGSIQDTLAKKLAEEGKIRVLKISEPYPNSIIAYNSTVDTETVETIKSALLAFEPTGKHADMLIDWDKTEMPLGFTLVLRQLMSMSFTAWLSLQEDTDSHLSKISFTKTPIWVI